MKLSEIKSFVVEAGDAVPTETSMVELKDLVADHDAKYAQRYIKALWDKNRLSYEGQNLSENLYDKIDAAVKAFVKDGYQVRMAVVLNSDDFSEFEWDATVDDCQEVYLGYSPSSNKLFIGYDAWLSEDDFNEAWDTEFKKNTGEEFDNGNEEHEALFQDAWKQYQKKTMVGLMFDVDVNGSSVSVEPMADVAGGFYGSEGNALRKSMDLIDLRLD